MDDSIKIINLAKQHNGIVTTKDLIKNGLRREKLRTMLEKNILSKISQGLYCLSGEIVDEYFVLQYRCPSGVFSYGTALYFHELSDRIPNVISFTVSQHYNVSLIQRDFDNRVKFHYVKKEILEIGVVKMKTFSGHYVRVYDKERTLCELIKNRESIDSQLYEGAITEYFKSKDKNIRDLLIKGKIFKIENEIQKYIEVLI